MKEKHIVLGILLGIPLGALMAFASLPLSLLRAFIGL